MEWGPQAASVDGSRPASCGRLESGHQIQAAARGVRRGSRLALPPNPSYNGFHEAIVCSPRDAVRVFHGSGVDVLILNRFVLTK